MQAYKEVFFMRRIDELKKDYEYIDSAFLYKKVMTTKEENDD